MVLSWLLVFANGFKAALYCIDVAGALDLVKCSLLLCKLLRVGIDGPLLVYLKVGCMVDVYK